jgi:hypothetical protein
MRARDYVLLAFTQIPKQQDELNADVADFDAVFTVLAAAHERPFVQRMARMRHASVPQRCQ